VYVDSVSFSVRFVITSSCL